MAPIENLPVETLKQREVSAGEIIFLEGQPANEAYVILRGEVQVLVRGSNGDEVVINRMKAGEMFGEIALLTPNTIRTATTSSAEGCTLVVIDKSVFDKHVANADGLLRFIIDHLCRRIAALTERARDAPKAPS
ncbi:MAG: cyclic nucleotide-binding domain-containing protein [Rhodospirillaceae bacterium]|nr:cyclic nucleotide-binding domain-containing protein [Rhodospirillaceae bacterium]